MKRVTIVSILLVVCCSLCTYSATTITKSVVSLRASSSLFRIAWSKLIGIGLDIKFGTNMPKCKCCYGGLCEIKISTAMIQNGPLTDSQLGDFANGLLANDQAGIGITESGDAFLIFNRNISRPEFSGSTLVLQAPVGWDTELSGTYGIHQMQAGSYDILDNGLFKYIKIN